MPSTPPAHNTPSSDRDRTRDELLQELRELRREYVNLRILQDERDEAVQALRKSEERYRRIVESANDIIYRIDPKGFFMYANPCAERIMGYSLREIDGKNFVDFVRADYRKRVMRHYLQQAKGRIPVTYFEFPAIAKDGRQVWLGQNVQVILEGERIVELQAVARDITEIKKAEEERLNLERQFRQAQKMESIGRLAGGIAHDFNNILGIILAYTSILEGGRTSGKNSRMSLDAIRKAVERAKKMVKELLTLAHKSTPQLVYLDLNASVQDFTTMIMETFPRTIAFSVELDEDIPGILADSSQLDQVLLNLYVNARDAMEKGGTLTVTTSRWAGPRVREKFPAAEAEEYVCLTVSDTGIGMDETTRVKAFEPFFSTKQQRSGSGLGLAVVYGIVQSHKGLIDVVSAAGQGSSFHIFFPAAGRARFVQTKQPRKQKRSLSGKETILFVEDEELLRSAIGRILQDHGYEVLVAGDGIEAVETFMKYHRKIDLVLSDLGLPGLGGWEACVTMREINPSIPLVLASGFIEPQVKAEMVKHGEHHFVQKPYETAEVLEKIREVFDAGKRP